MNNPLLRLSSQLSGMHRLGERFTGTLNVRYEFRNGMIVQVKRISSEEVIDLRSMANGDARTVAHHDNVKFTHGSTANGTR